MTKINKMLYLKIIFFGSLVFFTLPFSISSAGITDGLISIDVTTGNRVYLFKVGEPVLFNGIVKNNSEQKRDLKILFELFNYKNKMVWKRYIEVSVSSHTEHTATAEWFADKSGTFKARFSVWDNTGEILIDKELVIGVIRPSEETVLGGDYYLGTHLTWERSVFEKALKQISTLGIRWIRVHDTALWTWWTTVQPEKDKWVWQGEEQIDTVLSQGINILGLLESTPRWASSAPKEAKDFYAYRNYPPKDMRDFEKYVYETVKHYKGKIDVWEIWNEPQGQGFWTGTPEEYTELAKVAYKAAKEANPSCKVIVGGGIGPDSFAKRAIDAGLTKYGDYFSTHTYYNHREPQGILDVEESRAELRHMMMKSGNSVLPIWDTEMNAWIPYTIKSFYTHPGFSVLADNEALSASEAAAGVARTIGLEKGLGIGKVFYYFDFGGLGFPAYPFDMSHHNGAPTIFAIVLSAAGKFVNDTEPAGKADWPSSLRAYVYDKGKGSTGCLWGMIENDDTVGVTVVADDSFKVYDIMGNLIDVKRNGKETIFQIGWEPVWIEAKDVSAEKLKGILNNASFSGLDIAEKRHERLVRLSKSAKEERLMEQSRDFEYALNVPKGKWLLIDMRKTANMAFHDDVAGDGVGGWADEGPTNDMTGMPAGNNIFCGVPFDIIDPATNKNKSVITLYGGQGQLFPKASEAIPVKTVLERLYFLHACTWGQKGNYVSDYYIYYDDGSSEKIDITVPERSGDWFWPPSKDEGCHVVSIDRLGSEGQKVGTAYLRILEWANPHPDKKIDRINIVSSGGPSVPIVISITGVKK